MAASDVILEKLRSLENRIKQSGSEPSKETWDEQDTLWAQFDAAKPDFERRYREAQSSPERAEILTEAKAHREPNPIRGNQNDFEILLKLEHDRNSRCPSCDIWWESHQEWEKGFCLAVLRLKVTK